MRLEHYPTSKKLAATRHLRALNDIFMIGTAFDDGRSLLVLIGKRACVSAMFCA